MDQRLCS
ncbi:hypothetical protein D030_1840A, partial [Vibrio parahaemolyticus AQ3810]